MNRRTARQKESGFSLIELIVAMTIMLLLMGVVSMVLSKTMGIRSREGRITDALASSEAALNVMSREISNSGFGIRSAASARTADNGILIDDSGSNRIHFRTNLTNTAPYSDTMEPGETTDPGEDVTYFFDDTTKSIVRYDPNGTGTSVVVNKISNVTFKYFDYCTTCDPTAGSDVPSANTSLVMITVSVDLEPVQGQPSGQQVVFTSQVNLRNSSYMLKQY